MTMYFSNHGLMHLKIIFKIYYINILYFTFMDIIEQIISIVLHCYSTTWENLNKNFIFTIVTFKKYNLTIKRKIKDSYELNKKIPLEYISL